MKSNNNVVQLFGANGQPVSSSNETETQAVSPIFQEISHSQVSTRYHHAQTSEVLGVLQSEGWEVIRTQVARVRKPDKNGFQKHYAWLRPQGSQNQLTVGDAEMRIVLSNSHDGTSAFRLEAGLHRLVCSNGLMISVGDFERISVSHIAQDIEEKVLDGAFRIAAMAPEINKTIQRMTETQMSAEQQVAFAVEAAKLRWAAQVEKNEVNIQNLLEFRRNADKGDSLWNIFNVVQENMIRGGVSVGTRRARAVSSPIADIELNKDLFKVALKYAA